MTVEGFSPENRIKELEKECRLKEMVIESLNRKIDSMNELSNINYQINHETNGASMEIGEFANGNNDEYLKGVKSSYQEMISLMLDLIVEKGIESFGLELENEILKKEMGVEEDEI